MGAFWSGGGDDEGRLGLWAVMRLADQYFPGRDSLDDPGVCPVEISGEVRYRIDSQKPKGKSGHRLVVEGYEPTKCSAKVLIYTEAQWAAYVAYFPTINPKLQENRRRAFTAEHPFLAAYGIREVFINEATFPTPSHSRFVREVRLSLWEVWDVRGSGEGSVPKQTDTYAPPVIPEGMAAAPVGTVSEEPRSLKR